MAPKIPTIYGLVAGILKGDVDQGSNWQMVEFTFDNLRRDGVGSNLHFYNALLEALWCLGQRERAARILAEGRRRGVLLEALSHTRMMWAIDVHRFHIVLYFIFLFIACTLKSYLMTFLSHLSFASLSWLVLLSAAFEDNQLLTNFNAFDGVPCGQDVNRGSIDNIVGVAGGLENSSFFGGRASSSPQHCNKVSISFSDLIIPCRSSLINFSHCFISNLN